jgi:hypothetical protein
MESRSRPDANERPDAVPLQHQCGGKILISGFSGGNRDARDVAPLTEINDHHATGGALTVPLASFCAAACVGVPGRCPWACPSIGGAA